MSVNYGVPTAFFPYSSYYQGVESNAKFGYNAQDLWGDWLSTSQYVWVPSYIVHGLLDTIVPGLDSVAPLVVEGNSLTKCSPGAQGDDAGEATGKAIYLSREGRGNPGAEDHPDILRKLALHLAAQPDAEGDPEASEAPLPEQLNHAGLQIDSKTEERREPPSPALVARSGSTADGADSAGNESSEPIMDPRSGTYSESPSSPASPIFCATPEEHAMPVWSGTYPTNVPTREQTNQSATDCVCVPTHIAYGLLNAMTLGQGTASDQGVNSVKGARSRPGQGPLDSEFHQQVLRKLALHLAAQPDNDHDPNTSNLQQLETPTQQVRRLVRPGAPQRNVVMGSNCERGKAGKSSRDIGASFSSIQHSPQQQEFHQQMLRKLALHLAAQPDGDSESGQPEVTHNQTFRYETSFSGSSNAKGTGNVKGSRGNGQLVGEGKGSSIHPHLPQSCSQQHDFHKEILQKLALHLAAQPDPLHEQSHLSEAAPKFSAAVDTPTAVDDALATHLELDPMEVGEDAERCEQLIEVLEDGSAALGVRRKQVLTWTLASAGTLALTRGGSRLVQRAISVATPRQREHVAEALLPATTELYTSPHANHVLAKLVEVLPPARSAVLAGALRGRAAVVARHQFGCRILQRLVEHCGEDYIGDLLDELLEDLEALARHSFGNFVVQHLLEHGALARKGACVQKLLPHVLQHATHKTASNVVQRMLEHSDLSWQTAIADAFLAGEGETALEAIAATRYGSFVIHHLVDRLHPRIDAVKARVKAARPRLQESGFSQRKIVDFLGEAFFRD